MECSLILGVTSSADVMRCRLEQRLCDGAAFDSLIAVLAVTGGIGLGLEPTGLLLALARTVRLGLGAAGRELLLGWIFA
ncbi:hypothetical protein [Cohnella fermenti]|uniref:hypothetical protein n=1 Tax=Cohnella fermenti TaxID=2565925 RepID=UPI001454B8B9|nr:hypothetical protein [Cohnella fermenti]